jgi:hypothetical protein
VPYRKLVATAAAVVLLAGAAGCGGGGEETAQPQVTPTATAEPEPTADPAGLAPAEQPNAFAGLRKAALQLGRIADRVAVRNEKAAEAGAPDTVSATFRRDLTYALTEHVYLLGLAAQTAVTKSETSQVVKDALDALDDNTGSVVELVGAQLENADREEFRTGWLAFTRAFYDYAVAVKDEDTTKRREAETVMNTYRQELAVFFTTVTDGDLPQYQTKAEMKDHIYVLRKALDAVAGEDPAAFDLLREAAESVAETAVVFTKGFLRDAEDIGDVEEQLSTVRAKLASLTVQHSYLAAMSYVTAFTDAKRFSGTPYNRAKVALDDNAKAIGDVVKDVATSAQQVRFLEEWRRTLADLESYAEGAYFDNETVRKGALEYLEKDLDTAGRFFDRLTKGRDAEVFAADMGRHIATFMGTIDALKAGFARARS